MLCSLYPFPQNLSATSYFTSLPLLDSSHGDRQSLRQMAISLQFGGICPQGSHQVMLHTGLRYAESCSSDPREFAHSLRDHDDVCGIWCENQPASPRTLTKTDTRFNKAGTSQTKRGWVKKFIDIYLLYFLKIITLLLDCLETEYILR